jgi:hypothetical protein
VTVPPVTVPPVSDIGADTPIWDELAPRWAQMQARFREMDKAPTKPLEPDQPVPAGRTGPAKPPQARSTPRRSPNKGATGSSTRRAANTSQASTEKVSVSPAPEAEPEEAS